MVISSKTMPQFIKQESKWLAQKTHLAKQLITVATHIIRFESIQLLLVGDTTRQNWCEQPMFLQEMKAR